MSSRSVPNDDWGTLIRALKVSLGDLTVEDQDYEDWLTQEDLRQAREREQGYEETVIDLD